MRGLATTGRRWRTEIQAQTNNATNNAWVAEPHTKPRIMNVISRGHCIASASLSDGVIPPRV
ncbi:MAG: hypothetical protein O3B42_06460, partial [Actinomycetota bacterium]|nr:hypothetical protein [Actinomycetota bacterium]